MKTNAVPVHFKDKLGNNRINLDKEKKLSVQENANKIKNEILAEIISTAKINIKENLKEENSNKNKDEYVSNNENKIYFENESKDENIDLTQKTESYKLINLKIPESKF